MTATPYLSSKEPALQHAEMNGIAVDCLYMNYKDIEKKHGYKANPFLPPDLGLTPKQMIVFDLTITNKEAAPIKLDSRVIELYFGDKRYPPMSAVDMERKIDEYAEKGDNLKEGRVAKAHMLPNITTIRGNSTTSGYLVFMGTFRGKDVPAELALSFKTADEGNAGDITFNYTLTLIKK